MKEPKRPVGRMPRRAFLAVVSAGTK